MDISFGKTTISLHKWDTREDLEGFLGRNESILLGGNPEGRLEFYSLALNKEESNLPLNVIGVCSEGHGLKPGLFLEPEKSIIWIGYNSNITAIKFPEKTIVYDKNLDSLFYYFWPIFNRGMLLIIHEIGVVALNEVGQEVWKFSKDIITKS